MTSPVMPGLDDLRFDGSILLIEWREKIHRLQRELDGEISLKRDGESGQRIRIVS